MNELFGCWDSLTVSLHLLVLLSRLCHLILNFRLRPIFSNWLSTMLNGLIFWKSTWLHLGVGESLADALWNRHGDDKRYKIHNSLLHENRAYICTQEFEVDLVLRQLSNDYVCVIFADLVFLGSGFVVRLLKVLFSHFHKWLGYRLLTYSITRSLTHPLIRSIA